jgi:predicted nucleic acid-binding protein
MIDAGESIVPFTSGRVRDGLGRDRPRGVVRGPRRRQRHGRRLVVTVWPIDKSALVRLAQSPDAAEWASRIQRGLVRISTVTRLEVGFSARSADDLRSGFARPPLAAMPPSTSRRSRLEAFGEAVRLRRSHPLAGARRPPAGSRATGAGRIQLERRDGGPRQRPSLLAAGGQHEVVVHAAGETTTRGRESAASASSGQVRA